jgi:hypothetical protein
MKILEERSAVAVLLEYKQEGMDAEALACLIKQRFPNLPIILLSACDQAFPACAALFLSNAQRTSARVDRCELVVDHVLGSDPDGFVVDTPMGR